MSKARRQKLNWRRLPQVWPGFAAPNRQMASGRALTSQWPRGMPPLLLGDRTLFEFVPHNR